MFAALVPSRWTRLWVLFGALACLPARALEEQDLKAAIVFNVLLFVEWPKDAAIQVAQAMVLCLDRSTAPASFLALQGRMVGRLPLEVRDLPGADWRSCHAMYLDTAQAVRFAQVKPTPGVLVISDGVDVPPMASSLVLRRNGARVAFEINLDAVRQSKLHLSSKLLRLAQKVKE